MALLFYTNAYSTYCTRVRFFLEEADLVYAEQNIDLGTGEQLSSKYRSQYAQHKVPTIRIGDFNLGESNTIMRYLAQKQERFDLYPIGLEERAQVDQWTDYCNMHICRQIGDLAWYRTWAQQFKFPVLREVEALAEHNLSVNLKNLDQHLQGRHFLVGARLTIADIAIVPFLDLSDRAHINLSRYANISRYMAALVQRPAWQKVKTVIK